jgi:hypothetical protein
VKDAAQIALFRKRLFFEVEQGGTFERKHGTGALQDIGQDIARGIADAMSGKVLEFCTQHRHQFVKGKLLLQLQVFLTMWSRYTAPSFFQIENCCFFV